jgi:hypothetical protein
MPIHTVGTGLLCRYSCSLWAGCSRMESWWGWNFLHIQTGPGAHPTSHTVGIGSFLGVKWPGRGAHHPPPFSTEVKERVELYIYSPSGPSWTFTRGTSPFFKIYLFVLFIIFALPRASRPEMLVRRETKHDPVVEPGNVHFVLSTLPRWHHYQCVLQLSFVFSNASHNSR